ncbi:type III secretion system chaperone [bacterium]|nr:type III secretion system chaperone [bacterium]
MDKKLILEKAKKLDEGLNKLKIPFEKVDDIPGLWFFSIQTEKNGPVIKVQMEILDESGQFLRLTASMGDLPSNPSKQWAMFLRMLQLNYDETSHGRFAVEQQKNEIVYALLKETDTVSAELPFFLNLLVHIYRDVRPSFLGFVD